MKKIVLLKLVKLSYKLCSKLYRTDAELAEMIEDSLSLLMLKYEQGTLGIESLSYLRRKKQYLNDKIHDLILSNKILEAIEVQSALDTIEAKLEIHYGE